MPFFSSSSWQSKEKRQPTIARCGLCGLHKKCFTPKMPPSGRGERKILFIAEAPGEQEDRQGTQLIGESGQLLRNILDDLDLDLEDCWRTNAVLCRPPENKIERKYIDSCRPSVIKSIKELSPNVIILLGKSAIDSLISPVWRKDVGPISRWVGWKIPMSEYGAWVCPTYHPAYLLRLGEEPLLKEIIRQHLKAAIDLEKVRRPSFTLDKLKEQVEIIQKDRLAKARLRDLLKKKGQLAFDYETTGLKPEKDEQRIVSCSFCFEGEDTFAYPMTEGVQRLTSKVLQSWDLKKIASNLKFEERWTRAKFGHGVDHWIWDTMLAAHVIDNRPGITSIKFQSFIHLGIGDYNSHIENYLRSDYANDINRIHELDIEDLLMYNGLDSLLEFLVAEKQMEILK